MKIISITSADYVCDYKIALIFDDGIKNTVDFEKFIKKSRHKDIKKYQNIDLFKRFNVNYGDLEWNDYDLAFPIYDLYENKI